MDNYSLSVGVIVIKDSKVLLVKHNYGSANGKYLNPGGFLKDGEGRLSSQVQHFLDKNSRGER